MYMIYLFVVTPIILCWVIWCKLQLQQKYFGMHYRTNDLHLSGIGEWQIQQFSNNSQLVHQSKSSDKNLKRWKQRRSIQMKQDYQNSQSRANNKNQNISDKFDQIAYEEMLKNKARQFIIKIRRQKQRYYGKLVSVKINQENSKIAQSKQAEDNQSYEKSIRQQRTRVIELKRIKRLSQLKLKKQTLNDTHLNSSQQDIKKSSSTLNQQKHTQRQKQPKYKTLQTIPEDKSKDHRVLSINRLNRDKKIKTQPSQQHHKIDTIHQMKSLSPKRVVPSSSNHYFQSRGRLPQSKLLLTAKDRQQIEDINNKMAILIKLNSKK